MTTVTMLDTLLLVVALAWLTLSVAVLTERLRYDRLTSRLVRLRMRLVASRGHELKRISEGVTADDFDQLVVDGVPLEVESAIARGLLGGARRPAIVQSALGHTRGDVWKRIRDAQVLTSARTDDAYPSLDGMLRSGDRVLSAAALRLFVRLDDRRSAELLVGALVDGVYARSRVAAAFAALTVERIEALGPLFASDEPSVRYWGARLTLYLGARRWVPQVRELTTDSDPFVRRAAVEALGVVGTDGDAETVVTLLGDPVPIVRAYAARAAAAFKTARNVDALYRLLDDRAWIVRSAAAEVLGTPPRRGDGNIAA